MSADADACVECGDGVAGLTCRLRGSLELGSASLVTGMVPALPLLSLVLVPAVRLSISEWAPPPAKGEVGILTTEGADPAVPFELRLGGGGFLVRLAAPSLPPDAALSQMLAGADEEDGAALPAVGSPQLPVARLARELMVVGRRCLRL